MRLRLSSCMTLVGVLGAVLSTIAAAHLPATPTYASPLHSLTANDFVQVAAQGFGDRANSEAAAMAWYNNKLYVGTSRNEACLKSLELRNILLVGPLLYAYPPSDPDVSCPGIPPTPKDLPSSQAAQIWAFDPGAGSPFTQANWTKVYQDPYSATVLISGTAEQAPRDMAWRGMSVYNDVDGSQSLYVSGSGIKPMAGLGSARFVPPPALLRTTDGVNFRAVPSDPGTTMGDVNYLPNVPGTFTGGACCLRDQVSYGGKFFLIVGSPQGGGAVFASSDPRQGDSSFQQITPPSMIVHAIAAFNGHLYLGVQSQTYGYSVWRTDCTAPPSGQAGCPGKAFKMVVPGGAGLGKHGNYTVTSMHVFTDNSGVPHLYIGTDGASNNTPAELIRINQDDSWDLIVGNFRKVDGNLRYPLSGQYSGFGWFDNLYFWRMEDLNGVLYVGTFNNATIQKNTPAGQYLQPWMGFGLWATSDGINFTPVTQNGFGDMYSYGVRTMKATPYGLFVGSANQYYGLRVWLGQVSQSAMANAPNGAQSDGANGSNSAALSWDAAGNASVYHVYRSAATQMEMPPVTASLGADAGDVVLSPSQRAWIPAPYTEVGTTTSPYFVDHDVQPGKRYSYYVVAQDNGGNLSAASNVTTVPAAAPLPTFSTLRALIALMQWQHRITQAQARDVNSALARAQAVLKAGDAAGCHVRLAALRQQVLDSAPGLAGRPGAEIVALMVGRLEKRVALVDAHVLAAARIG